MHVTALAGGTGGARFLEGLRAHLTATHPGSRLTVIANNGDDITLFGLRVCPDLDTLMYTLGGGVDPRQRWGRCDETWVAQAELAAYGADPQWFALGDRDLATHVLRTALLADGQPLSQVTGRLCARWLPTLSAASAVDVRLLPSTDDPVETHVTISDPEHPSGTQSVHFQEYLIRLRAEPPALRITLVGAEHASAAPGVSAAIRDADVVLICPSNPVVSIGTILAIPQISEAVRATAAPIVGVSPIIGDAPVRGIAHKVLPAVGTQTSAAAVAARYGSRRRQTGILDGWLVDTTDSAAVAAVEALGVTCRSGPLLMTDLDATVEMACWALRVASGLG